MVFLALTPAGLAEALKIAAAAEGAAIWCGADAISAADFEVRKLARLTRLSYSPGKGNGATYERALDTIAQHHPDERVWVEGAA